MAAVVKAFSLCGTLDEAGALRKEIAFFSAIKAAIAKFTTVDKKRSDAEKNSALKQILDNAIISDGVAGVGANDVVAQLTGITSVSGVDLTGGNLTITG